MTNIEKIREASREGQFEVLRQSIAKADSLRSAFYHSMMGACESGQVDVIRFLRKNLKSNFFKFGPFSTVCGEGSLKLAQFVITYGDLLTKKDLERALVYAVNTDRQNTDLILYLLRNKKFYNKDTIATIWKDIYYYIDRNPRSTEIFQAILATNLVDVNSERGLVSYLNKISYSCIRGPILAQAVGECNISLVQMLLARKGIKPNMVLTESTFVENYADSWDDYRYDHWSDYDEYRSKTSILRLAVENYRSAWKESEKKDALEIIKRIIQHPKVELDEKEKEMAKEFS